MDKTLKALLETIDGAIAEQVDKLEELIPQLEEDTDAFIADDVRDLLEDIRGIINA